MAFEQTPLLDRIETIEKNHNTASEILTYIENKILQGYKLGVSDAINLTKNAMDENDLNGDSDIELIDRNELINDLERLL